MEYTFKEIVRDLYGPILAGISTLVLIVVGLATSLGWI